MESIVTKMLINIRELIGVTEDAATEMLGAQIERTDSFAKYKVPECDEVMLRISDGLVTTITIWFSLSADSPEEALQKAGIILTTPPSRTAPAAAWWTGEAAGINAEEVGAIRNAGAAGAGPIAVGWARATLPFSAFVVATTDILPTAFWTTFTITAVVSFVLSFH